jgi:predicted RND superfamily exporter protein
MQTFSAAVIRRRKEILVLTVLLCIVSVFVALTVRVNYDLASYLPKESPSTKAMGLISAKIPNLQVYLPGVPVGEVSAAKEKLKAIPGVEEVLWLDDAKSDMMQPLEMMPPALRDPFYQDGPMFQATLKKESQAQTVPLIRETFPDALLKGEAADTARVINTTMKEIASIMVYVVPICFVILILATHHWLEPVLFLLAIGAAILINEGTNVFLGSVSFVTRAASAVLQLAVSIDYAVFLLHRFSERREEGASIEEAMRLAMQQAASSIASSAMTTVFGFMALMLMRFGLGMDMGIVLTKGVILSYLSVMVVLPAATVSLAGPLEKTAHRQLLPSFKGFGAFVVRRLAPLALIALFVLPLAFSAQQKNDFIYGTGGMHSPDSAIKIEQRKIEEIFGQSRMMLMLVPSGSPAQEAALGEALLALPEVESITSYAATVGVQVPQAVLPQAAKDQFLDGDYSRLILAVNTADEGPEAFRLVKEIRAVGEAHYPGEAHLVGESAVNLDLKTVITGDNMPVLLAGIIAIGLVLLVNFKNLLIPLILLLVIEGAIWLNMGVPYVMGQSMNYIGYQIVSSVQLGATVDYGILLVQRYLEGRETMDKRRAAAWALGISTGSILPPALILTSAGYLLGILVRENGVISQMGIIIGRGAAISCAMVLLVLPTLLVWCDGFIMRTFIKKRKEPTHETNLP